LAVAERALRDGWPLTPEVRAEVIAEALRMLRSSPSERTRLMAMRVLLMADGLNARRESNPDEDRIQRNREAADRLRALMSTPQGQEAINALLRAGLTDDPNLDATSVSERPAPALPDI
jgi:hypothetical protein